MTYVYEAYLKGPLGESGWEIVVGYVENSPSRENAKGRILAHYGPKFDCFIRLHESIPHERDRTEGVYLFLRPNR